MTAKEKAKLARRIYMREYRKRNRDKIKRYEQKFWAKKFEDLASHETESSPTVSQ